VPVLKVNDADVDVVQTGAGRDLVLLHSLLADRTTFDRAVPALARHRRLTLINLPGYGASTPAGDSIETYADHVADTLRALDLRAQTDLLGNGFGGFIAIALAIRDGRLFDRLVVSNSLAAFPPPAKEPLKLMAERVSREGMNAVLDAAIKRMFPDAFAAAHPDIVAERRAALANADPTCFSKACLALTRVDFNPLLSGIRNKTLVLAGALDEATPAPLTRALAAGIPGSTFIEIAGCGHTPQLEKTAFYTSTLEDFLA
jgi:3-oxoadipate enol-lactonase